MHYIIVLEAHAASNFEHVQPSPSKLDSSVITVLIGCSKGEVCLQCYLCLEIKMQQPREGPEGGSTGRKIGDW